MGSYKKIQKVIDQLASRSYNVSTVKRVPRRAVVMVYSQILPEESTE